MALTPRDVIGRPRGLLGIWRAWGRRVYRFEMRRRRLRKGAWRQRVGTWVAAGIYVVSVLYLATAITDGAGPNPLFIIPALAVLYLMPIAVAIGSPSAGVRAFAGERANGTLDALVMSPVPRYDLVAGRLLAHVRPYVGLFLVFAGSLVGLVLLLLGQAPGSLDAEDILFICASVATGCFFYFSALALGVGLGLCFGLRLSSAAGALAASIGILLAVVVLECVGYVFAINWLMTRMFRPSRSPVSRTVYFLVANGIPLALAGAHVLLASWFVNRSARSFDAWTLGKGY